MERITQSSLNSRDCYREKTDTSEYLDMKRKMSTPIFMDKNVEYVLKLGIGVYFLLTTAFVTFFSNVFVD